MKQSDMISCNYIQLILTQIYVSQSAPHRAAQRRTEPTNPPLVSLKCSNPVQ